MFAIIFERMLTHLAVKCVRMLANMAINELTKEDAEKTISSLDGNGLKVITDIRRKRQ